MTDMDPERYYDEHGAGEWDRLTASPVHRLEFESTTDALARRLPDSGRVLDAGGGPGRYSLWLAERGHEVVHCDLSTAQIELAREKVRAAALADCVTCHRADVRDLPFETDGFDAVCCLGGPLSHVLDPGERASAVRELRRVAAPDAPAFVSVMGRVAAVRDILKHWLDEEAGLLVPIAETGDYTRDLVERESENEGWAETHFFRAVELAAELEAGGLTVETMVGLEGPASNLAPELADATDDQVAEVREAVRLLREGREAADAAEHMLAVCRA